jgi:hypothetical protein
MNPCKHQHADARKPQCIFIARARYNRWAAAALVSLAGCGGRAVPPPIPATSSVSAASAKADAPRAPEDTRPYGYEFAPESIETIKKTPAAASLPTAPGGRLFPEAISGAVRNQIDLVDSCFAAGQKRNAKLAGTVTVRWSFGRDGVARDVSDERSTLPDKEVVACVVGVFRSIRFPTSRGGQVTVVFPIELGS